MVFFDDSRADRKKRARKFVKPQFDRSPIPAAKAYEVMSRDELIGSGIDHVFVYDVESYPNYFLVSFKSLVTGKVISFEDSPDATIDTDLLGYLLHRYLVIGFNSKSYDIVMVCIACLGVRAPKLKEISDEIIAGDIRSYAIERKYGAKSHLVNHIDLIDVAPITASLKIYGGRLHCERMQDLPYSDKTYLTKEQAQNVRDYNINDLDLTELLYNELKGHIDLRIELGKEYGIDLRSKSDAQVSEAIICSEIKKLGSIGRPEALPPGTLTHYLAPKFISYKTAELQHVLKTCLNTPFELNNAGRFDCPQAVTDLNIRIGNATYTLGVGGLHSTEKSVSHYSDNQFILKDIDVASYYPSIILTLGLFPPHLGPAFLTVYRAIYDRRLKAKATFQLSGDNVAKIAAEALKIVINGGFGKLSNEYSDLYAPHLGLAVTMCGQLSLLMLIEAIELAGIEVISGNTDGIIIKCPRTREDELQTIIMQWEETTGFQTEETRYKSTHNRDVNNYFAVKEKDGKCKLKGVFAEVGSALNSPLSKNPEAYICSLAVQEFLTKGIPIEQTVMTDGNNADQKKHYPTPMSRYISIKNVKGGGEQDGIYLGKAVRWYYSTESQSAIHYAQSGNTVGKSSNSKPCMIMPSEPPPDLDREHYVNEATQILYDIGYYQKPAQARLF